MFTIYQTYKLTENYEYGFFNCFAVNFIINYSEQGRAP